MIAAVGHGGMSWGEDEDKKKKVKMETGKPHAKKRRLTTSRKGNDKHQRKDDGAGDGSGDGIGDGSGGSGSGNEGGSTV